MASADVAELSEPRFSKLDKEKLEPGIPAVTADM
jgi:hypothetical protein